MLAVRHIENHAGKIRCCCFAKICFPGVSTVHLGKNWGKNWGKKIEKTKQRSYTGKSRAVKKYLCLRATRDWNEYLFESSSGATQNNERFRASVPFLLCFAPSCLYRSWCCEVLLPILGLAWKSNLYYGDVSSGDEVSSGKRYSLRAFNRACGASKIIKHRCNAIQS